MATQSQNQKDKEFPVTLLVVDDSPDNLRVLTRMLESTYRVLTCNSGKGALELAASQPRPDLILLDVMMPGLDGYETLALLKANPATHDIPVVFVTAMVNDEDQRRGLDLGAVDYIFKPFRSAIMLARVRTQLELQRAVNDLRNSEMRWQFAVESRGDAMWDWDAERDELYLTTTAKELFELPEAVLTQTLSDLLAQVLEEDRPLVQAQIDDMVAGKTSEWLVEWRAVLADGAPRWIGTCGRVMTRSPNGQPRRIVSISHDATQRKLREVEDGRQRALLAHQGRLVLLGELASALAHEMNQPLTAIAGFAGAAARQVANQPPALELVRSIEEQAMRAGEIARRMRSFARRQRLGPVALSLHEVVGGVAKWIRVDQLYSSVLIDTTGVDVNLPKVDGDRVELEQVLFNLVRNGIEAGLPELREQRIVIAAVLAEQSGGIEVTVTDWGNGLPADANLEDFSSFNSTKASGLGLGLTISASIIEGHGGRLWATQNPQGGTIFHFTLPVSTLPVKVPIGK